MEITSPIQADGNFDREVSVVIPTYGNANGLPALHERLLGALEALGRSFEVIYVDDCSPDDSWNVLQQLRAGDDRVHLLRLLRNVGQQGAVLCGMDHARGRWVVTMDDDLQHRPEEIQTLLEAISQSGDDAIIGRYDTKKHGLVRRMGSRLVKGLARRTVGIPVELDMTSFRVIRNEIVREMMLLYNPSPVVGYLLFQVTPRISNVEVHHDVRFSGKSNYSFRHLIRYFTQMVLDYSDLPLRVAGYVGFAVASGSFVLSIYYFLRALRGTIAVQGWATLVLLLTFLCGLILMTLGIIGIYLVRILRSVNAPTRFVVRERVGAVTSRTLAPPAPGVRLDAC